MDVMNIQENCLNCDFYDLMIAMKKRKKRNESFIHTLEKKINHKIKSHPTQPISKIDIKIKHSYLKSLF
jgi:hypothetical protein